MASVQTAPALPQGGAIIPPNLSPAQLQGMLDVCSPCIQESAVPVPPHELQFDRLLIS